MKHITNREAHAFEEGAIAEVRGEGLVDNPYDPDIDQLSAELWEYWRKGYIHSQEENEME
jgi:hypothetical protein